MSLTCYWQIKVCWRRRSWPLTCLCAHTFVSDVEVTLNLFRCRDEIIKLWRPFNWTINMPKQISIDVWRKRGWRRKKWNVETAEKILSPQSQRIKTKTKHIYSFTWLSLAQVPPDTFSPIQENISDWAFSTKSYTVRENPSFMSINDFKSCDGIHCHRVAQLALCLLSGSLCAEIINRWSFVFLSLDCFSSGFVMDFSYVVFPAKAKQNPWTSEVVGVHMCCHGSGHCC